MSSISSQFAVFNQALAVRSERHQLLASNIANADTPNYKARDLDFSSAMASALSGRGGLAMARTAKGHLDGMGGGAFAGQVQFRTVTQGAVDGNTVDMDVERAAISENALQYEVLTRLVSDRLQGLRSAMAPNQ